MIKQIKLLGGERMVKNRWIVALVCIAMAISPVVGYLAVGVTAETAYMHMAYTETREDGKMVFSLSLEGSGVAFTMVNQTVEGESLIIKPRVSLVSPFHNKGEVQVVTKVPVDGIDKIWLQGVDTADRELVWNNTEGSRG